MLNINKTTAALISVASNSALVVAKLTIGLAIGSVSVISEAIHSGVDLLAAVIALFAVRAADVPADDNHRFGHGKFENLSGTIEALLIFVAAGWILYESIHKLLTPKPLDAIGWGVIVMLLSSVVNWLVSQMLFRVGKRTDSIALKADAWHLRTDVYTSAGVMGGLGIIWLGKIVSPSLNLSWIDPVSAILVALLIIHAAYELTMHAIGDLLDVSLPPEEEICIKEEILKFQPQINGFHNLRSRKSGNVRFVEFHITVDAQMSVQESHNLNDLVIAAIKKHFENAKVMVHIEPCTNDCTLKCKEHCLKYRTNATVNI